MLSYQTFITFPNLSILTPCCFINFCHFINLSSSYQTSVIFSPLVIYSLFTLASHPINSPTVHITKHNSLAFLVVRTLSAPIYLPNPPGVFGHRAILTVRGGLDRGWGFPHRTNRYASLASTCPHHWLLLILLHHPSKPAYFVSTPLA